MAISLNTAEKPALITVASTLQERYAQLGRVGLQQCGPQLEAMAQALLDGQEVMTLNLPGYVDDTDIESRPMDPWPRHLLPEEDGS